MYNAAHVAEVIKEAKEFGFSLGDVKFDWGKIKIYRDRYIKRLNGIYEGGLDKLSIQRIAGFAHFVSPNTLSIDEARIHGKHIVIATGGMPMKLGVPGEEHLIDSDGFFALEEQPKKVGVIGAGYIAVELAGVFHALGTDTSLFVRGDKALRAFDSMLSTNLDTAMKKSGINVIGGSVAREVTKEADGTLMLHLQNGTSHGGFDRLLCAIGRAPMVSSLRLAEAGVATTASGHIAVDDFQNTNVAGVYALGDVCGKVELTPMAIAAGRRLGDRLFGGMPDARADYENVPTVIFSHPVIGTCGMTEEQAVAKYGAESLKVYNSGFVNLWYGTYFEGNAGDKPVTKYKLICQGEREVVVGLHMIGMSSDEVLQGFGVAMKMGATKADFDNCVAIHPTAAEEMVTFHPWGLGGSSSKK